MGLYLIWLSPFHSQPFLLQVSTNYFPLAKNRKDQREYSLENTSKHPWRSKEWWIYSSSTTVSSHPLSVHDSILRGPNKIWGAASHLFILWNYYWNHHLKLAWKMESWHEAAEFLNHTLPPLSFIKKGKRNHSLMNRNSISNKNTL